MTAAPRSSTHDIDLRDEIVVKRYRSWDRREPHCEWAALTLLTRHAPGLAPAPVTADLHGVPPTGAAPAVLGLADGNLANYLWDAGSRQVRLVDWEDSGRADRAFELAEVAEHISHIDGRLDADLLLGHLGLGAAEVARVREFRRLLALGWLLVLGPDGPAACRNPPGALVRQAERVLALL